MPPTGIHSAIDYYPFGMEMPKRALSPTAYRFGFNGKENDNEVAGTGSWQNYGMREYDTRIARFISVDPLTKKYPELTPYQFASNRPIDGIDLDGLEWSLSNGKVQYKAVIANSTNKHVNLYSLKNEISKQYKRMFGVDFEINLRVCYSKDYKVAKDEGLIEIQPDSHFGNKATSADGTILGRHIGIKESRISEDGKLIGAYSDEGEIYDESAYAEEIGHTGGLSHPFELRKKGTVELQNISMDFGNFMSYPENDSKDYFRKQGKTSTPEERFGLSKYWLVNPGGATSSQKAYIKFNIKWKKVNQGGANDSE